jgi:ribosome-interacting GTPase 1
MPANLPPQYFEAEKRYRRARTPQEKIEALEEMFSLMPKHKGTDRLRAELRTKIAKFYEEAQKRPLVGRKGSLLYYVKKEGAGQCVLLGLPSVGKSQLIATVTGASSQVADYPFTTQVPIPGMMPYENVQFQLVDLPAINAPNSTSWLPNIVRNADLVLLVIDLSADPVGQMNALMEWLARFRMAVPGQPVEDDRSVTKQALIIGNKLDTPGAPGYCHQLTSRHESNLPVICVSARRGDAMAQLGETIYRTLDVIRVYTKAPGGQADLSEPVVVPRGTTAAEVAESIHKDIGRNLKFAQIWGSGKFAGQKVRRDYVLQDGDVIELHT